jgi:hypothetical protein
VTDAAITAVPPQRQQRPMVTHDRAAASHALIARISHQARRKPHKLTAAGGRPRLLPGGDLISLTASNPEGADQCQQPGHVSSASALARKAMSPGKKQAPADCPRATHDDEPLNPTEHHRRQDHR